MWKRVVWGLTLGTLFFAGFYAINTPFLIVWVQAAFGEQNAQADLAASAILPIDEHVASGDQQRALSRLSYLALHDNAKAQYWLGYIRYINHCEGADIWLHRASDQGYEPAFVLLAFLYYPKEGDLPIGPYLDLLEYGIQMEIPKASEMMRSFIFSILTASEKGVPGMEMHLNELERRGYLQREQIDPRIRS